MTTLFSISVAAARWLPIALADLFVEEFGEAVRSMVRVASHVAITAEQWRQGAPQQRRRATALVKATDPVLLVLGAVQTQPATCSVDPKSTVLGAPRMSVAALETLAHRATDRALGPPQRRSYCEATEH